MNPTGTQCCQRGTGHALRTIFAAVLCCAAFLVGTVTGAERADIVLNDGQVLKSAKIVSIGETSVAFVYEGGVISVAPERVPLDALTRAHLELYPNSPVTRASWEETNRLAQRNAVAVVPPVQVARVASKAVTPKAVEADGRSALRITLDAFEDSPKTTIFFTAVILCGALAIFSRVSPRSGFHAAKPIATIAAVACLGIFVVYLWQRPPPPPPPPETPESKHTQELNAAYMSGQRDAEKGKRLTDEQMMRQGMSAELRFHYRAGYDDKNFSK